MATLIRAACIAAALLAVPELARADLRLQRLALGVPSLIAYVEDPATPGTFFAVSQTGVIRVVQDGVVREAPFLDLRADVSSGGERGLLGLAFPSDAAASGRLFVNFTNRAGHTVIARFTRSPDEPLRALRESRFDLEWGDGRRLIEQPFSNHNGGHLAFGPDGYLYIGLGDGGSANDPRNLAQTLTTALGKMLRIDVSVPDDDSRGYVVPSDNPFLDRRNVLPEIWALGYRNPWRYTFDDVGEGATGALIVGDVGQGLAPAGATTRGACAKARSQRQACRRRPSTSSRSLNRCTTTAAGPASRSPAATSTVGWPCQPPIRDATSSAISSAGECGLSASGSTPTLATRSLSTASTTRRNSVDPYLGWRRSPATSAASSSSSRSRVTSSASFPTATAPSATNGAGLPPTTARIARPRGGG
jgi:Glucose / Sorbosone dehydrogenase